MFLWQRCLGRLKHAWCTAEGRSHDPSAPFQVDGKVTGKHIPESTSPGQHSRGGTENTGLTAASAVTPGQRDTPPTGTGTSVC